MASGREPARIVPRSPAKAPRVTSRAGEGTATVPVSIHLNRRTVTAGYAGGGSGSVSGGSAVRAAGGSSCAAAKAALAWATASGGSGIGSDESDQMAVTMPATPNMLPTILINRYRFPRCEPGAGGGVRRQGIRPGTAPGLAESAAARARWRGSGAAGGPGDGGGGALGPANGGCPVVRRVTEHGGGGR